MYKVLSSGVHYIQNSGVCCVQIAGLRGVLGCAIPIPLPEASTHLSLSLSYLAWL